MPFEPFNRRTMTRKNKLPNNLTDPMEIRHALERKLGNGALTIFANAHGYSLPYISQTVAGERGNEEVLRAIASCLGQPVRGILPRKQRQAQTS